MRTSIAAFADRRGKSAWIGLAFFLAGSLAGSLPGREAAGQPAPPARGALPGREKLQPGSGWIAFRFVDETTKAPLQVHASVSAVPEDIPQAYRLFGWRTTFATDLEAGGLYRIDGIPDAVPEVTLTFSPNEPKGQTIKRYAVGKEHLIVVSKDPAIVRPPGQPDSLFTGMRGRGGVLPPRAGAPLPASPWKIPDAAPAGKGWIEFRFFQEGSMLPVFADFQVFANKPQFTATGYSIGGWKTQRTALSAKNGIYRIEGIPDAAQEVFMFWDLDLRKVPQYGPYAIGKQYNIMLPAGAGRPWPSGKNRASFRFVDAETSQPLTTVSFSVFLAPSDVNAPPQALRSILFNSLGPDDAKDGIYAIAGLDADKVYIGTDDQVYIQDRRKPYAVNADYTIALRRQGWIRGRVIDAANRTEIDQFEAKTPGGSAVEKYGNGGFRLRTSAPIGSTVTLTVASPGFGPLEMPVRVEAYSPMRGADLPDLALMRTERAGLHLMIADGTSGAPLKGAIASLIDNAAAKSAVLAPGQFQRSRFGPVAVSNGAGEATLSDEPGNPHAIFVSAPGHAMLLVAPDRRPEPMADGALLLLMRPEASIEGTFYLNGAPAANRHIMLESIRPGANGNGSTAGGAGYDTDGQGRFRIDQLQAGGYAVVGTTQSGSARYYLCDLCGTDRGDLREGEHVTIVLGDKNSGTVVGTFYRFGKPAPKSQVGFFRLSEPRRDFGPVNTDEQGHYQVEWLSPGKYVVSWIGPGDPRFTGIYQVVESKGAGTIDIKAPGEGLTLRVDPAPAGAPPPARIWLYWLGNAPPPEGYVAWAAKHLGAKDSRSADLARLAEFARLNLAAPGSIAPGSAMPSFEDSDTTEARSQRFYEASLPNAVRAHYDADSKLELARRAFPEESALAPFETAFATDHDAEIRAVASAPPANGRADYEGLFLGRFAVAVEYALSPVARYWQPLPNFVSIDDRLAHSTVGPLPLAPFALHALKGKAAAPQGAAIADCRIRGESKLAAGSVQFEPLKLNPDGSFDFGRLPEGHYRFKLTNADGSRTYGSLDVDLTADREVDWKPGANR